MLSHSFSLVDSEVNSTIGGIINGSSTSLPRFLLIFLLYDALPMLLLNCSVFVLNIRRVESAAALKIL